MSKTDPTYAQLELRARLDLAARVLADPAASPEHLAGARHTLTTTSTKSWEEQSRSVLGRMTTGEKFELADLFRRVDSRAAK